jgi:hypothetical protein
MTLWLQDISLRATRSVDANSVQRHKINEKKMIQRLVTSDDIGLVKDIDITEKTVSLMQGQSGADRGITCLAWVDEEESELAIATSAGVVEILQFDSEKLVWGSRGQIDVSDPVVLMRAIPDNILLVVTECELIKIKIGEEVVVLSKISFENGPYNVASFMAPISKQVSDEYTPILQVSPTQLVAATEARPPVIVSLETGKIEWSGKNANDTPLGINSKFHTTCLIGITDRIFAAGDQSGKIRFYDIKNQRKPVLEMPIFDTFNLTNNYTGTSGMGINRPITILSLSLDSSLLFIGDTFGTLISINISKAIGNNTLVLPGAKIGFKAHNDYCRKLFAMNRNYKGMMGSVRDVAVTKSILFVVTAGRYAYSFDIENPKKNEKIFLKQKLTACLPKSVSLTSQQSIPEELAADSDTSSIDEAANDLINNIDVDDHYVSKQIKKSRR